MRDPVADRRNRIDESIIDGLFHDQFTNRERIATLQEDRDVYRELLLHALQLLSTALSQVDHQTKRIMEQREALRELRAELQLRAVNQYPPAEAAPSESGEWVQ